MNECIFKLYYLNRVWNSLLIWWSALSYVIQPSPKDFSITRQKYCEFFSDRSKVNLFSLQILWLSKIVHLFLKISNSKLSTWISTTSKYSEIIWDDNCVNTSRSDKHHIINFEFHRLICFSSFLRKSKLSVLIPSTSINFILLREK